MEIIRVKIDNFRNLNNFEIINHNKIKYIVGNNGIGKSNTLEAINSFFNKASFLETDFNDILKPITIEMGLKLSDEEFGYFDDLFDIDENTINIRATQDSPNDRIEFYHIETNSSISYQKIRNLPCVYYNSINAPEELNFIKSKNSGKFLNSLIEKYLEMSNIDVNELINSKKIDSISEYLNSILKMISFVSNNNLEVDFEHNIMEFIPRLIELKDKNNISVNKMGSGIRYSSYIYFELLNIIMQTIKGKNDSITVSNNGKKYLSIFILLDEPEIHLHPYMQRSVINDIRKIIENRDSKFLKLLKEVFDIDYIFGQLIVVTHSPNIISNDFHEIIRIDYQNNNIKAYTDDNSNLNNVDEKNFKLLGDKIKEIFFSKACILVEGSTERITIPIFAKELEINLDDLNIGIIQADGGKTIPSVSKVLEHFGIKTVSIVDSDLVKKTKHPEVFDKCLKTEYNFFEEDYIRNLIKNNRIHVLYKLMLDTSNTEYIVQKGTIESTSKKLEISEYEIKNYKIKDLFKDSDNKKKVLIFTSWLTKNKDAEFNTTLAENSKAIDIPYIYRKALEKAEHYAKYWYCKQH